MCEQYGPCGEGWKYEIEKLWTEAGACGEILAFAQVKVFTNSENGWSYPIPGIGGSTLIALEKRGKPDEHFYNNDEAYKMAVTDALSVALKMLGVSADVYAGQSGKHPTDPVYYPIIPPAKKQPVKTPNPAASTGAPAPAPSAGAVVDATSGGHNVLIARITDVETKTSKTGKTYFVIHSQDEMGGEHKMSTWSEIEGTKAQGKIGEQVNLFYDMSPDGKYKNYAGMDDLPF